MIPADFSHTRFAILLNPFLICLADISIVDNLAARRRSHNPKWIKTDPHDTMTFLKLEATHQSWKIRRSGVRDGNPAIFTSLEDGENRISLKFRANGQVYSSTISRLAPVRLQSRRDRQNGNGTRVVLRSSNPQCERHDDLTVVLVTRIRARSLNATRRDATL